VDRFWPGGDGIGRQFEQEGLNGRRTLTIVGITSNARLVSLAADAEPMIYVPLTQSYMSRMNLVIRTTPGTSSIADVRALLRQMNPILPITEALTLREVTALGVIPQRIAASVAGSLGIVGLLLAAIGIYGVTSYAVSSRTREIGVRIALGADRGRVMRLVVRQAFVLAGIGVGAGMVIAALGSRVLESLLFGIRPLDPITFAAACGIFAALTVIACYVPARPAAAVDPMVALRAD
jgi:ABC-type antimicrobial peptide transport system permease subunit